MSIVGRDYTQRPFDPSKMDPMEQEIRNLLADEAVRQKCNGLARNIRDGRDDNARTLIAIQVVRDLIERMAK